MTPFPTSVVSDLRELKPAEFITRWFDETPPYLFGASRGSYLLRRSRLAADLGVSWFDVVLVGSAAVGHSLSPYKNFKPFSDDSDIDVATMSPYYFDLAWRWMRRLGAERYGLPPAAQQWVKEHEKRLVYWGAIATDQLLQYLCFDNHVSCGTCNRPDGVEVAGACLYSNPQDRGKADESKKALRMERH